MDAEHPKTKSYDSHLIQANSWSRIGSCILVIAQGIQHRMVSQSHKSQHLNPTPAAVQEAGMAEQLLPHPKANRPKPRFPKRSPPPLPRVPGPVSSVSGEPPALSGSLRFQMTREAVNQMFRAPSPFSSCSSFLYAQQPDETGNRQATVLTNLSSSPCSQQLERPPSPLGPQGW